MNKPTGNIPDSVDRPYRSRISSRAALLAGAVALAVICTAAGAVSVLALQSIGWPLADPVGEQQITVSDYLVNSSGRINNLLPISINIPQEIKAGQSGHMSIDITNNTDQRWALDVVIRADESYNLLEGITVENPDAKKESSHDDVTYYSHGYVEPGETITVVLQLTAKTNSTGPYSGMVGLQLFEPGNEGMLAAWFYGARILLVIR
jgi:hypothetical protein